MKFKKTDEPITWTSDEDFYALREGYMEEIIEHLSRQEDRDAVYDALRVLVDFFDSARESGVLGDM